MWVLLFEISQFKIKLFAKLKFYFWGLQRLCYLREITAQKKSIVNNLCQFGINKAEPGWFRTSTIDLDLMALDAWDVVQFDLKT